MFRKILVVIGLLLIVAGIFGYKKYLEIYAANVPRQLEQPFVNIPTGASYEDVLALLKNQNILIDWKSFDWLAEQMKYKQPEMRPGRFKIEGGWSNRKLINHLRAGQQSPVKLVLNNERLVEEVAGKAARFIEADSTSIFQLLNDEAFLASKGYSRQTIMSIMIPNTYEFFWNTSPLQFFERMQKEHDNFWAKNQRLQKAEKLNMTPLEVYSLASIVERESNKADERPRIAGVYLNRLQQGIPLQADPTVVFATRDFGTRRVLNRHLEFDSPYNTYMYRGLPPGPISMASINSIDAVLNAEKHDYIFFCARPDESGYHAFAKTLAGHNANAEKYRKWLNSRGVR